MHAPIAIGSGGLGWPTVLYALRRAPSIQIRMVSHHASQIQPEQYLQDLKTHHRFEQKKRFKGNLYIWTIQDKKERRIFDNKVILWFCQSKACCSCLSSQKCNNDDNLIGSLTDLELILAGHVLISPKRLVQRFTELTAEETSDLWFMAQRVGIKLEDHFKASSLTFAIQDGPEAGQTVPHVHIHILPRKVGDFQRNDVIYDLIEDKEKELKKKLDLDNDRMDRTEDEMAKEADALRALF